MPASRPSADVAALLRKLPPSVKAGLKAQCDGEWERVTTDGKSFKVHNNAAQAAKARAAASGTDVQPAAARPAPAAASPEPAPEPEPAAAPEPAPTPAPEPERRAESVPEAQPEQPSNVTSIRAQDWRASRPSELIDELSRRRNVTKVLAARPVPHCERCGRDGHYTEDCRTPLPTFKRPQPVVPEQEASPAPATPAAALEPTVAEAPAQVDPLEPTPTGPRPFWERMEERRKREAHKKKTPPTKRSGPRTSVELEVLARLIGSEAPRPETGVRIVSMSEDERRLRAQQLADKVDTIPARADKPEDLVDELEPTVLRQLERCKDGLPAHLSATLKPDVEILYGIDKQGIEDTLRHPQRVTIRPESYQADKRYPVLAFYRGDIEVILGMRFPDRPAVIAAYIGARLMHDTHRVNHMGGGGRKREDTGTPKTPRQVVSRLRGLGADIEDISELNPKPVRVIYKGQDLGAISVDKTTRATCESDYQRMQRKIHAIDRRGASVG